MTSYIENNTYIVELKASELKTERQFMETLWDAFNIPYEKDYRMDVLNDWMRDLSWIEPKSFKIKITGYYSYLQKGYNLHFIIEQFEFYKEYWNGIGYTFDIQIQ